MSGKSDIRQLLEDLDTQGFEVAITGSNHYKVTKPGVDGCVFMPCTPSDYRGKKNAVSQLRRTLGYEQTKRQKGKKK